MDLLISVPDDNARVLLKFLKQKIKNHKASNRYVNSYEGKRAWNQKELKEREVTNNLMIHIYQPIVDQMEKQLGK